MKPLHNVTFYCLSRNHATAQSFRQIAKRVGIEACDKNTAALKDAAMAQGVALFDCTEQGAAEFLALAQQGGERLREHAGKVVVFYAPSLTHATIVAPCVAS